MMVWSLFIIDYMGLFFYNKIGSIISIGDLPTTNIIEPEKLISRKGKFRPFFFYVTISPSRSVRCETKKPSAMRVRVEGYTKKKLRTRYNKGVQANCKAKGEKYGTKGS